MQVVGRLCAPRANLQTGRPSELLDLTKNGLAGENLGRTSWIFKQGYHGIPV